MKKVLVLMMTLVLMLAFVACDGDQSANVNGEGATLTIDSVFTKEEKAFIFYLPVSSGEEFGDDQYAIISGIENKEFKSPVISKQKVFFCLNDYVPIGESEYSFKAASFSSTDGSSYEIKYQIKKGSKGPYVVEILYSEDSQKIKWIDGNTYTEESTPDQSTMNEISTFMGLMNSEEMPFASEIEVEEFVIYIVSEEEGYEDGNSKKNIVVERLTDNSVVATVESFGKDNASSFSNINMVTAVLTAEQKEALFSINSLNDFSNYNTVDLEAIYNTEPIVISEIKINGVNYSSDSYETYLQNLSV